MNQFLQCFVTLLYLVFLFLHTKYLQVLYDYLSTKSTDCFVLSSFELKAILLIFNVKALCPSLLNVCCVFNVNLLLFYAFYLR